MLFTGYHKIIRILFLSLVLRQRQNDILPTNQRILKPARKWEEWLSTRRDYCWNYTRPSTSILKSFSDSILILPIFKYRNGLRNTFEHIYLSLNRIHANGRKINKLLTLTKSTKIKC